MNPVDPAQIAQKGREDGAIYHIRHKSGYLDAKSHALVLNLFGEATNLLDNIPDGTEKSAAQKVLREYSENHPLFQPYTLEGALIPARKAAYEIAPILGVLELFAKYMMQNSMVKHAKATKAKAMELIKGIEDTLNRNTMGSDGLGLADGMADPAASSASSASSASFDSGEGESKNATLFFDNARDFGREVNHEAARQSEDSGLGRI
jgi:hypothetical protein